MTTTNTTIRVTRALATPDLKIAPAIRPTWRKRPDWAASSCSGGADGLTGIAASYDTGNESGIAPCQVSSGGLRAALLVELLGQVTTGGRKRAHGLEISVASL